MGSVHEQGRPPTQGELLRIEDDLEGSDGKDIAKATWFRSVVDEMMAEVKIIMVQGEASAHKHAEFRDYLQAHGVEPDAGDY